MLYYSKYTTVCFHACFRMFLYVFQHYFFCKHKLTDFILIIYIYMTCSPLSLSPWSSTATETTSRWASGKTHPSQSRVPDRPKQSGDHLGWDPHTQTALRHGPQGTRCRSRRRRSQNWWHQQLSNGVWRHIQWVHHWVSLAVHRFIHREVEVLCVLCAVISVNLEEEESGNDNTSEDDPETCAPVDLRCSYSSSSAPYLLSSSCPYPSSSSSPPSPSVCADEGSGSLEGLEQVSPVLGPRSECSGASTPDCEQERGETFLNIYVYYWFISKKESQKLSMRFVLFQVRGQMVLKVKLKPQTASSIRRVHSWRIWADYHYKPQMMRLTDPRSLTPPARPQWCSYMPFKWENFKTCRESIIISVLWRRSHLSRLNPWNSVTTCRHQLWRDWRSVFGVTEWMFFMYSSLYRVDNVPIFLSHQLTHFNPIFLKSSQLFQWLNSIVWIRWQVVCCL